MIKETLVILLILTQISAVKSQSLFGFYESVDGIEIQKSKIEQVTKVNGIIKDTTINYVEISRYKLTLSEDSSFVFDYPYLLLNRKIDNGLWFTVNDTLSLIDTLKIEYKNKVRRASTVEGECYRFKVFDNDLQELIDYTITYNNTTYKPDMGGYVTINYNEILSEKEGYKIIDSLIVNDQIFRLHPYEKKPFLGTIFTNDYQFIYVGKNKEDKRIRIRNYLISKDSIWVVDNNRKFQLVKNNGH